MDVEVRELHYMRICYVSAFPKGKSQMGGELTSERPSQMGLETALVGYWRILHFDMNTKCRTDDLPSRYFLESYAYLSSLITIDDT